MTVPSKSRSTVPVTLTFESPCFFSELITTLYVFCMNFRSISLLIAWEIKYQKYGYRPFTMLNVAHVKNDVKWRPIVTKSWHTDQRIWVWRGCMTAIFFWFSLKTINYENDSNSSNIGVLHAKVKYWRIICDVTFSARSSIVLLFHRIEYPKMVSMKKIWNFSMAQFLWHDCTFKKQCTCPCDHDLWHMKVNIIFIVNWVQPYKYPV